MKEAAHRAASCVGRPPRTMTALVQTRSWRPRNATSGIPRTTDIARPARLVRFVPIGDIIRSLVGASEQCRRHGEERFGGLEVHHQFELGRLFDRKVGGLRTLIGRTGTGNSM